MTEDEMFGYSGAVRGAGGQFEAVESKGPLAAPQADKATKIEAKISYFNKVIKKENMKNPQKTINVAHLVLATLNWPVR